MCEPKDGIQSLLVLASASPRRKSLLTLLGLPFVVHPADVEEVNHAGEGPGAMAVRLSATKAGAVSAAVPGNVVIAADTLVYLDGEVLGKPADEDEAIEMLRSLRSRPHVVFSGVTLIDGRTARQRTELATTMVQMRCYSDDEIAAYVSSGDPMDKAGAYAIQYCDFRPVERVGGCYANVMGLPLCHLYNLLRAAGFDLHQTPVAACNLFNSRSCDVADTILRER
jgi:septum formation protein